MAWWQKKLLRFALARTGLLDDNELNLDDLDMTWGKKNVIELKNVGLNIQRLDKLAQLPPSLRIETARVLSLRLTVPADIYQSGIVAELDGVRLHLTLDESNDPSGQAWGDTLRSQGGASTPSHRKVHRRTPTSLPHGSDGGRDSDVSRIPTAEEVAQSFLSEESPRERRELEASVVADSRNLEESVLSDTSDGDAYGTGVSVGVPGFLTSFLQGVSDRLQVKVKNIDARLRMKLPEEEDLAYVTLKLQIDGFAFSTEQLAEAPSGQTLDPLGKRNCQLSGITLDLISDTALFDKLSVASPRDSPSESRITTDTKRSGESVHSTPVPESLLSSTSASHLDASTSSALPHTSMPELANSQRLEYSTQRPNPAEEDDADFDIKPGDDNISWGSRRSQSSIQEGNLWSSMTSEDGLPESLLLDPAPPPKSCSSGSISPEHSKTSYDAATRSMRHLKPYSEPGLNGSSPSLRLRSSPGSWPVLDEETYSSHQSTPLAAAPTDSASAEVDMSASDDPSTRTDALNTSVEDLEESRVFSHEEAQSMYMSALSYTSSGLHPDHFDPDRQEANAISGSKDEAMSDSNSDSTVANSQNASDSVNQETLSSASISNRGNMTPRPASVVQQKSEKDDVQSSLQLLHVDWIHVRIPSIRERHVESEPSNSVSAAPVSSSWRREVPGSFSAYSELSSSRLRSPMIASRLDEMAAKKVESTAESPPKTPFEIGIGIINVKLDLCASRLLYQMAGSATSVLSASRTSDPPKGASDTTDVAAQAWSLKVGLLRIDFSEPRQPRAAAAAASKDLVSIECRHLSVDLFRENSQARIAQFEISVGSSKLLHFQRDLADGDSTTSSFPTPDVILQISHTGETEHSCTHVEVRTTPVYLLLDLLAIDDALDYYGGLSGVLEFGSSVLSSSDLVNSPPQQKQPPKGVRFTDDPQSGRARSEIKIDLVFEAITAALRTESCRLECRTSKLKAIYREQGLSGATWNEMVLTGPVLPDPSSQPLKINLMSIRLEYAVAPQDRDLERLLTLLTPSKDKYDSDDDILVDTLLRQRKKGAVLRLSVAKIKGECDDWEFLTSFDKLSSELTKLSAVTKYLPEDERPGILTLLRVKETELYLPVNTRFGRLLVGGKDLHCAHVGLPSLLAISLGGIQATQVGGNVLAHSLIPAAASDNLPMIMARMLGNEMEPTIKIKIFNLCLEYSVSLLLGLTNMDKEACTDEVVAELAKSVAGLGITRHDSGGSIDDQGKDSETMKQTKVKLLIHDSAIGLSPQQSDAKALVILTDVHFSALTPSTDNLSAVVELRKAAMFVADEVAVDDAAAMGWRGTPHNSATKSKVSAALFRQGFVSVGSIMAAKATVRVHSLPTTQNQCVEVDVESQLLLLETCADSTKTLTSLFGQLVPPAPPSKQPKYLMEPMTIDDMMASFSGDPYAEPGNVPEKLFDAEEDQLEDSDMLLDLRPFEGDADDLIEDSEMVSSLYGPISGTLDDQSISEDGDYGEDMSQTAESLLEDDPFEMPSVPSDGKLSDTALARDLNKQARRIVKPEPLDLELYEIEDLGFDALQASASLLAAPHRFTTSASVRPRAPQLKSKAPLPFRLRLRDLHIIWNIYDGYDWQRTRDGISEAVERVEVMAEERKARRRRMVNDREDNESVIGDFLFNSIYIGVPSNFDAQDLRRQINRGIDDLASETESIPVSGISRPTTISGPGHPSRAKPQRRLKLERSRAHKVAFELKGLSADILVYPEDSKDLVSSIDVRVRDFEIFDNVPTSTWRKFLTSLDHGPDAREMSKPMLHIEILNVRTLEDYAASELAMHVSVLPLRLHVDQDALDFITRFFEFKDNDSQSSVPASDQPFLQRVEVDTVDMCLDYKPKTVDYGGLRSGHTTEFMNFVILDGANIRLKHAIIYGIKGFEPLHKTLNDVWMPDIKRNQLPTILAGLAPVRSLVNIGTGVRDVVAIPIREYRKDGRIIRSIQKGAFHFGKTTTAELARLGAKVAIGTQTLLQGAEGVLSQQSPSSSARPGTRHVVSAEQDQDMAIDEEDHEHRVISAYADQPIGVFAGLRSARRYLERDLLTARDALIAVQGEVLQSASPGDAAAALVRHAPTILIRPVTGMSRAVGTALLGVGNQIDRGNVRRVADKYKKR